MPVPETPSPTYTEEYGAPTDDIMTAADTPRSPTEGNAVDIVRHDALDLAASEKTPQDFPNVQVQGRQGTPIDAHTPISYLYLSFESDLPPPPSIPDDAPPPNLEAYVSPLTWSPSRKALHLALGCLSTFLTAYCAGSYAPPLPFIVDDFGTTQTVGLVGITTFCMGFALAPMVLAPVSEIWGRYPVFVAAGVVTVVSVAACAVVTDIAAMLACRFIVGAGVSVFSSVVGGVMADLWVSEERNTPMALYSGCVLIGTGAGPLVSSAIVVRVSDPTLAWKWTFYHQVIADGLLVLALALLFKETRASVLLRRKAAKLNSWYDDLENHGVYGVLVRDGADANLSRSLARIRWRVQADAQRASLGTMMLTSVLRPLHMLATEPVVFFFSLWAAFGWGILYLAFAVVPHLHGGDFSASMRTYIAMMAGAAVATATSIWQEDLLSHRHWQPGAPGPSSGGPAAEHLWALVRRHFPADAPEARLYFTCVTGFLLPAGLFGAFLAPGTTSSSGDGGTSLAVGIGFATWGIYAIYLASFNYLADTYHVYASSALAANSFCRNILGGAFPVVTGVMFDNLGVRGAGGLLGGLAMALTATPWALALWGSRIRARSSMAQMLQRA